MTYQIDLTPEQQRLIEYAAAQAGVTVESFIVEAAETEVNK